MQEGNFFFQVRCLIYKGCCLTKQYLTLSLPHPHYWLTYPIGKSLVSTIFRKKIYAELQEANFSFQAIYFIRKGCYSISSYFTLFPPHPYSKTKISTRSIVKERYQNSIITLERNSRTYQTAMPYISKANGSIAGHNANLVFQ